MTVSEAIRKRYSCRSYEQRPIEKEKLEQLFEAARLAPSAMNKQDWCFVVVTDKTMRHKIAKATNKPEAFEKAAAIIVACSNSNHVMRCGQAIGPIDVSIALEHIALQAVELGLATCWIGSFKPEDVKTPLDIPSDIAIIELMALGYPADKAPKKSREPVEKIVCYEKWQF
jgi:nitroreductase